MRSDKLNICCMKPRLHLISFFTFSASFSLNLSPFWWSTKYTRNAYLNSCMSTLMCRTKLYICTGARKKILPSLVKLIYWWLIYIKICQYVHFVASMLTSFSFFSLARCIHDEYGRKEILHCTFFGSVKEFSSIKLVDVSMVFVDPTELTAFCNPVTQIFRFTVAFPKLTICTKSLIRNQIKK